VFDRLTSRLTRLETRRDAAAFPEDCPTPPPAGWPGCRLQSLHYAYDPVGNHTSIRDGAQQTIFFRNRRVTPDSDYTYDAVGRLIEATGREHLGRVGGVPLPHSYNDGSHVGASQPTDGNAMGRYVERYVYDMVGNLQTMRHHGTDPAVAGWTRGYTYDESSLIETARRSNRLTSTTIAGAVEVYSHTGDGYDEHGNQLRMPQVTAIEWSYKDELRMASRQTVNADDADGTAHAGERTWFIYDASGQRVRALTESPGGTVRAERIYLEGLEIYRRHTGGEFERQTLHLSHDDQRIALVEKRTRGVDGGPAQLIRFQIGDHLNSVRLELDDAAQLLSYEEYTPYGSTSHQAADSRLATARRYRYSGKERDEPTGLYYHGARYYAPWLGRWTSCDRAGMIDGVNLYTFARNNPMRFSDPTGNQARGATTDPSWLQLPTPRLLQTQSVDERLANRVSGTLAGHTLTYPGASSLTLSPGVFAAAPATGPTERPGAPPVPRIAASLLPPQMRIDYGAFNLTVNQSAVSVGLGSSHSAHGSISYRYGSSITLTTGGPESTGSVSFNPHTRGVSVGFQSTPHPGPTVSLNIGTEGRIALDVSGRGWNTSATTNLRTGGFNVSVTVGGPPLRIGEIAESFRRAWEGAPSERSNVSTPGLVELPRVLADPARLLPLARPAADVVTTVRSIAAARPGLRFQINAGYEPRTPEPTRPPSDFPFGGPPASSAPRARGAYIEAGVEVPW